MRQVLELEIQLANITVPQDQRRDEEDLPQDEHCRAAGGAAGQHHWKGSAPAQAAAPLYFSLQRQTVLSLVSLLFLSCSVSPLLSWKEK